MNLGKIKSSSSNTRLGYSKENIMVIANSSVVVCVDSQAAIKALESVYTSWSLVRAAKKCVDFVDQTRIRPSHFMECKITRTSSLLYEKDKKFTE